MLSKKQKFVMIVLGIIGLLAGLVVAVPFRSFPFLNKVENVLELEAIIKLGLAGLAVLLAIFPLIKKYQLVNNFREQSKVMLVMTYLPAIFYALGALVNMVYALSFDYGTIAAPAVLSEKVVGVVIAAFVAYFVLLMYVMFRVHAIVIKLDKVGNILCDVLSLVILVCVAALLYHINGAYNTAYSGTEQFFKGNPLLLFIYIGLVIALYLGIKFVSRLVRKDEVLVYFVDEFGLHDQIKQVEFNRAYNDVLDDYEAFFDESVERFTDMKIEALEEVEVPEEDIEEIVEAVEEVVEEPVIEEVKEDNTPVAVTVEATEEVNPEELANLEKEKEELVAQIAKGQAALAALTARKEALESNEAALRAARAAYDQELSEFNKSKLDSLTPEEKNVEPVKKVKKIVPSFEKMLEFANSFSEKEGFKVVSNAKGNLHKFYIGKKMCLVMQSTNNDYRISFITTSAKFVEYLKSRPGELRAPKNLKDNYWIRLVNKGKEEAKFMRQVIKQAFQTAEKQIADEAAAKVAEKKAKQEAKAKERAAARAAAKAAAKQE